MSSLGCLRRKQAWFYNQGVDAGLAIIAAGGKFPSKLASTYLLKKAIPAQDWFPPVSYQRAAFYQGLRAVEQHHERRQQLERKIWVLRKVVCDLSISPDRYKKGVRDLARNQQKLERLLGKGTKRFYRTRKQADTGYHSAVVVYDQSELVHPNECGEFTAVKMIGKIVLPLKKPFKPDEGWKFTGSVDVVECTRKLTRRTRPDQRRYRVHVKLKKENSDVTEPSHVDEVLGVDVGVKISMAVSDGRNFYAADTTKQDKKIRYQQRRLSKTNPGSRRNKKHRRALKARHTKKANQKTAVEQQNAAELITSDTRGVAVEDLKVNNMLASAKGTKAVPGKNVAAKRGLNKAVSNARFASVKTSIQRACAIRGVACVTVSPAGTSQHCHNCGQKGIRENQAVFICADCGEFNADFNAAVNIRNIGWEKGGWDGRPSESTCGLPQTGFTVAEAVAGDSRVRPETTKQLAANAA